MKGNNPPQPGDYRVVVDTGNRGIGKGRYWDTDATYADGTWHFDDETGIPGEVIEYRVHR